MIWYDTHSGIHTVYLLGIIYLVYVLRNEEKKLQHLQVTKSAKAIKINFLLHFLNTNLPVYYDESQLYL